jgi:hypothetical protein
MRKILALTAALAMLCALGAQAQKNERSDPWKLAGADAGLRQTCEQAIYS